MLFPAPLKELVAPVAGGDANTAFETAAKGIGVFEAAVVGDLLNGQRDILEQLLGVMTAHLQKNFGRRLARGLANALA